MLKIFLNLDQNMFIRAMLIKKRESLVESTSDHQYYH